MEPGQNRRDAHHFSTRRCSADAFSAWSRAAWRGMVSGSRSDFHPINRALCRQRIRVGAAVATPGFKPPRGVRVISLPGFPPVVVGAAWAGKLSPIAQQFLAEVEIEAGAVKRSAKSLAIPAIYGH